ncbi:ATP-dependent helicase HRQ1 isoform A [Senna tora]|uniref:ATP-dependent helicase HRQ1 isoform A n=1 Tax=Senna tora TaxID=362788 RepID=A0A835CD51_9FABA|nr:ATP-dependent helicase HRQ1 isoform A [Senna tora]
MADDSDKEIQIRTLSGESITLRFPSTTTVQHLKLLLNQTFPPASASPNFHLFFKGDKLRLQSQIGCYPIEPGEFLVLVPFTKKSNQCEDSGTPMNVADTASISKLADSTWSNIMEDLSYLRETEGNVLNDDDDDDASNFKFSDEHKKEKMVDTTSSNSSEAKSYWGFGSDKQIELPYHLILNTMQHSSEAALGEHNCEVLLKVLESINCLSDLPLGHCKLFKKARFKGVSLANNGSSCLCPPWLKKLMKAFTFINIFSAFLHLQCKKTTLNLLEDALNQLANFGVELTIQDMKHLSLLCPGLLCFATDGVNTSFGDAIVVINHLAGDEDKKDPPKRGRRWLYVSKIVSTLKRRDSSFRNNLWLAFSRQLSVCGDELALKISLEDLLASVKDQGSTKNESKPKHIKRSSNTLKSDSDHVKCHVSSLASSELSAAHLDMSSIPAVEMVEHLQKGIGSEGQIVHVEDICERKAIYAELPIELSENMKSALDNMAISKLYSHQVESIKASVCGKDVVVATMTSSGKSLCYNLPVLEGLLKNSSSCALYIFPTKALAQDQLRALLYMTKVFDVDFNIGIYDGDTSQNERTWLRDNSRLLITNPDMLHISILPHHQRFSRILSNLRFVVIDETHTYKGAFGCHTALILRRLKRLCSHVYGSVPSFVFSTATSANPCEHCTELANLPTVELVQNDGSPSTRKLFILWNPLLRPKPFLKKAKFANGANEDAEESANFVRSSPIVDVSRLFAEMVQHGLRCIAFCKSRKLCELVLSYTQEILHETAPHLVNSICAYRGGYIPEERRKIESQFFGGKICGVAATNALELGIDVGEIDVTLHLGFPGSIASLWQQAGRGGRRDRPSLAVYVAFGGPLDQYFMKHPKKLFSRPIECCHVDAQNKQVLEQHLVCAAHELPLSVLYDEQYFGPCLESALISLKAKGYLTFGQSSDSSARIWKYIGPEKLPSHAVNIRAIETIRYEVIDQQRKQVLEEIEESKAFFQVVYEGAVYMCQGKTYLVEKLDLSNKVAFCKEADLKYYTKTRDYTDIHVIGGNIAYPVKISKDTLPKTNARAHICKVTTTWFGFYRIWRGSNQIFDAVDLALPPYSYESQAVWIPVPQSIKEAVVKQNYDFRGGLHAASHAVLNVVPLYITCNLSDLAPECANPHDSRYQPERILIYDQHPGGSGLSLQCQPLFSKLLVAALELLSSCHCSAEVGCPNCVQSFACHEYNEVLHKEAAIMIIKGVLDAEM